MLTAHLPAGYCLARLSPRRAPYVLAAALIGAVLPDFDLLAFYLLDGRSIHHHRYWVHVPLFWALVAGAAMPLLTRLGRGAAGAAFFASIFVHLILDTIAGGIMWGAPVSDALVALVDVPATRSHFMLSFIFHWTFALEAAVWAAAAVIWARSRGRAKKIASPAFSPLNPR